MITQMILVFTMAIALPSTFVSKKGVTTLSDVLTKVPANIRTFRSNELAKSSPARQNGLDPVSWTPKIR